MAFKMRSGNTPKFKSMGSTDPNKTAPKKTTPKKSSEDYINEGFSPTEALHMAKHGGVSGHVAPKGVSVNDFDPTVPKPKKSTVSKHGQLNDAQLEYETDKKLYEESKKKKSPAKAKGGTDPKKKKKKDDSKTKTYSLKGKTFPPEYTKEDIKFLEEQHEDIVRAEDLDGEAKKLFLERKAKVDALRKKKLKKTVKKSPAKMNGGGMPVKTKGLGPRASFGGVKNPELNKKNKGAKKTKEKKVMKDGSKNRVHYRDKVIKNNRKLRGDWEPAYPGADYSKKEIAKMTEQEKARKIDGYTPKDKK